VTGVQTCALPIFPPQAATDQPARERFEREARAVATLNHPHICTLHDVGHHDGTDFLVMECLDGETLAQRLTKGALPRDEALRIAIQIADAAADWRAEREACLRLTRGT